MQMTSLVEFLLLEQKIFVFLQNHCNNTHYINEMFKKYNTINILRFFICNYALFNNMLHFRHFM